MADNIKESDVPVKTDLQYTLGFDGAGNWGKMAPPVSTVELERQVQEAKKAADDATLSATHSMDLADEAYRTADTALAGAQEAVDLANRALNQTYRLAGTETPGLALGPYNTNPVTGANLESNVLFSAGVALTYSPYLQPGSIAAAVEALSSRNVCVTLRLEGVYSAAWVTGYAVGSGWMTVYPYGMAMAGFYDTNRKTLGLYLYIGGAWTDLKAGALPIAVAASLDMDGVEAQAVPVSLEEPSSGAAAEPSDTAPAAEAAEAAEAGKEAADA